MIQYYGRAPKGERCFDSAPCGHWNTTTMLSSIRLDGNTECIVFRGAFTAVSEATTILIFYKKHN